MAAHKKGAQRAGRTIVFIDESGFMLQPVVRRTWAPRGQTPIHYSWDRHDRCSVISSLTISPLSRRLGLYFDLEDHNITNEDVFDHLVELRRKLGRDLVVVIDRLNAHRTAARRLKERYPNGFHFEWLPPYAPDLNPVEQVWTHTKYGDLANFIPDDIDHLQAEVSVSLFLARQEQQLLRSFFRRAKLPV
jgi:transposase